MSPSPSHSSYSLFSKLFKRLRRLHIVHQPTPFPTHHPRNFNNSPTHIDHVFVRIPSHMRATNIVREYRQSDHNSLTLYITPTEDSPSAESARNRTYNDPNFATFPCFSHQRCREMEPYCQQPWETRPDGQQRCSARQVGRKAVNHKKTQTSLGRLLRLLHW